MTHICVYKLTIIVLDNDLLPGRRRAIILTNAELLSIGSLRKNVSDIFIGIQIFYSRKCTWKCRQWVWMENCVPQKTVDSITYPWHPLNKRCPRNISCCKETIFLKWWRHQPNTLIHEHMITSSNGNIFRITGHLCGEFTGPRWIPRTKANDAELWCFFDLRLKKRLSKQSWGWSLETPSRPFRSHRNAYLFN